MENGGQVPGLTRSPYDIVISRKTTYVEKNGTRVEVKYFEGSWEIPSPLKRRPRDKIVASSRTSREIAINRTVAKVEAFLDQALPGGYTKPQGLPKSLKIEIPEKPDRTVKSFMEEWFAAQIESNRWQLSTKNGIQQKFEDYIYPYLGAIKLDELTVENVRRHFTIFLVKLNKLDKNGEETDTPRLSSPSIRNIFTHFHSAILAAKAKNYLNGDPAYKIVLPNRNKPHHDDESIIKLMDALINTFADEPDKDDQDTIRVALAFFIGLRRGERCGLRIKDIEDLDGKDPQITIAKQLGYVSKEKGGKGHFMTDTTKTGRPRKFPIPALLIPYLQHQIKNVQSWRNSPDWNPEESFEDLLLTTPSGKIIKLNDDSDLINAWLAKHDIDIPGVTAGDIRHASATWWVTDHGVERDELKKMFGWTKESEMDRYYARTDMQPLAKKAKNATLRRRNPE